MTRLLPRDFQRNLLVAPTTEEGLGRQQPGEWVVGEEEREEQGQFVH